MSEFIKNFVKKSLKLGTEAKQKGYDFFFISPVAIGSVEVGVMDGKDGEKSILQVVLITERKEQIQMYFAPAPRSFSEAETLFKLLELN